MSKKYQNESTECHLKLLIGNIIRLASTKSEINLMQEAIKNPPRQVNNCF